MFHWNSEYFRSHCEKRDFPKTKCSTLTSVACFDQVSPSPSLVKFSGASLVKILNSCEDQLDVVHAPGQLDFEHRAGRRQCFVGDAYCDRNHRRLAPRELALE